ncbi:restriction endonuclease subunit S, partial [Thermococci archaeon]
VTIEGAEKVGGLLPENTVLVVCIGSTIGKVALTYQESVTNQQINAVICNNKTSPYYLYYALLFSSQRLKSWSGTAAVPIIKKSLFETFKIPLPPLPEQWGIAQVLSTIDNAIQKSDELIAKIERLKKGLMQELLTKGIGHTKFKMTEIGEIPEDWTIKKLGKIVELKNGARPETVNEGTYPVYGANGIMGYTRKYLVDNEFTIVIGRVGASGEVHLGKGKIWVSDNAIYSESYDKTMVHMPFLYYLLKFKQLSRFATKTTHPIITQTFLKAFQISLPPLEEQQKIAEILSTVDKWLELERKRKEKLERLKKGLMNELLTGKIRVEVVE